jgi:mannan endo-1,4-beta-mannosidase
VDVIAWFLKQLDYAEVPVLWRPYHEMNGGWFWWGQKKGESGYKKLWQMMW